MNQAEADEGRAIIGDLLAGAQHKIEEQLLTWVRGGNDVDVCALLIGVRSDGCGRFAAINRRDLAKDLLAHGKNTASPHHLDATNMALDILAGNKGAIPVLFIGDDLPMFTLAWVQPISASMH